MDTVDAPVISLKSLRWSLLLLVATTLVAAAAMGAVEVLSRKIERDYKAALAQRDEARARLSRAHDDQREIGAKIARYQDILARGRTQPERRLEWVETLDNIKTTRRLLDLSYEIAPQGPLDPKVPISGGFEFRTSPMKLDLPLLHEDDLLGLLADLSRQTQALVSVRSCRIGRDTGDAGQSGGALLKAACELDWITLQEKS